MIYINDEKRKFVTYDDAVDIAIQSGIKPKAAYIYLAATGVKGLPARIANPDTLDYYPVQKVAVHDRKLVTSIKICTKCKGLIIQSQ